MKTMVGAVIALIVTVATPATSSQPRHSKRYVRVSLAQLLESPTEYFGKTISTSGKVEDVYSAHMFTIEEDPLFDARRRAIVIVPEPAAIAVRDSDVSVTGVVRLFTRSEMADKYRLAELADGILSQWERQPVILAQSVRTDGGAELVAPFRNGTTITVADAAPSIDGEARARRGTPGTDPKIDDIADIVDSNERLTLVGRPATLPRARVERIAGPRSFWIGSSGGSRVFVVVDAASLREAVRSGRGLKVGDIVSIRGTMERVPGTLGAVRVTSWGRLDGQDATALSRREVYVFAKRVSLVSANRDVLG